MAEGSSGLSWFSSLAEAGIVVTLASGLLRVSSGFFGAYTFWDYGFPFVWKEGVSSGPVGRVSLNGFAFLLDVLFYMAVGYLTLVVTRGRRQGWALKSPHMFLLSAGYIMVAMTWFALISWANVTKDKVGVLSSGRTVAEDAARIVFLLNRRYVTTTSWFWKILFDLRNKPKDFK